MTVKMRRVVAALACVSTGASAALLRNQATPVQKVVKLLEDMKTEVSEEAKKDEEMYKKVKCECKTNGKEKTAAIEAANSQEENLRASVNENAGKAAKYAAETKAKKQEVEELETSLEEMEDLCAKEVATMKDGEVDLVNTVTSLKMALQVLKKNHEGFLQLSPEAIEGIASIAHTSMRKSEILFGKKPEIKTALVQTATGYDAKLLRSLTDSFQPSLDINSAQRFLKAFVQSREHSQGPAHVSAGSAASGGIVGILEQMLEDFTADLSEDQKALADKLAGCKKFKAAKGDQLKSARDAYKSAKQNAATATQARANDEELLDKTEATKNADIEFLRNLGEKCRAIDTEYEKRTTERNAELEAISETVGILTEDDNREALTKGMAASFVQINQLMTHEDAKRIRAIALLQKASRTAPSWDQMNYDLMAAGAGTANNSPKKNLSMVAERARLDSFAKVKEMIDQMVADIKAQLQSDVETKATCSKDINTNEVDTKEEKRNKELLERSITKHESSIQTDEDRIAALEEQVKETQTSIAQASQDREQENHVFQVAVQEQRATQDILNKALARMKQYYEQKSAHTPDDYQKSAASTPVIALLDKIIADSADLEGTAMKDEQESQAQYEQFVGDSNNAINRLNEEKAVTQAQKADTAEKKVQAEGELQSTDQSIENLGKANAALHQSCDFLLTQFEVRQTAMQNEVEALQQAKSILSGMK